MVSAPWRVHPASELRVRRPSEDLINQQSYTLMGELGENILIFVKAYRGFLRP